MLGQVAVLELPLLVLLHEHGANQAANTGLVGKDPDDVGSPLHFLVESLQGVGGVQLHPVGRREVQVGQNVGFRVVHQRGRLALDRIGFEQTTRTSAGLEFWGSSFIADPQGVIKAAKEYCADLNRAIAVARVTPGPMGIYVVAIGYAVAGWPGAAAGWLALALPAALKVLAH